MLVATELLSKVEKLLMALKSTSTRMVSKSKVALMTIIISMTSTMETLSLIVW